MSINSIYKSLFSHRKGFTQSVNIVHRDSLPVEVINAINSAYFILCKELAENSQYIYSSFVQKDIEELLWWKFLNYPLEDFYERGGHKVVFRQVMESAGTMWYRKLDMLEFVIRISMEYVDKKGDARVQAVVEKFAALLNDEFERLDFGYRIVKCYLVDITSEEEIECINKAIEESKDNVRIHLLRAIELYSLKPTPDVQNSIKESISAVEVVCREYTGQDTLGKAIKKLEENGIVLQTRLKASLEQMYTYTNQPDTGIRHALMNADGTYVPSKDEAYFMLISCSAFVHYIRLKAGKIKMV